MADAKSEVMEKVYLIEIPGEFVAGDFFGLTFSLH
jgi:hypothetical protein